MPIALVAVHFIIAALAPLGARLLGLRVFYACAVAPAATVVWALSVTPALLAGEVVAGTLGWLPAIGLTVDYRVDAFSLLMIALVSGIGTLIFLYGAHYFAPGDHAVDAEQGAHGAIATEDLARFSSRLTAFAGAMLGLVLVDNLLVLYVFWELTSITSYLLIGFEDRSETARKAALQAIIVTVGGGLAMLAGLVLVGQAAGTYQLSAIVADPPTTTLAGVGALLTLAGAFTKSAQVPTHTWLPAAMAAPTPVSAYLHSATMVKAGVYLVARLAPAFALTAGWRPLVIGFGLLTMLVGGLRALRQHDLKLLLAYGTVSQLGFMMTLFGAGFAAATRAAATLLLGHALFKATLFLVAGIIDHQTHTRDIRRLSGVGRRMPALAVVGTVAAMSMAGLPPLLGFIAKEEAYQAYLEAGISAPWPALILLGLVAGSALTFAYSHRFVWGAFATKADMRGAGRVPLLGASAPAPSVGFIAPPAVLMTLTVATGIVPRSVDGLVHAASGALIEVADGTHLALWHGPTAALGLSLLTVAAGIGLVWVREPLETFQRRYGDWPGSQQVYDLSVRTVNVVADRVTGVVQSGSLPAYLAVIALTLVVLPGSALLRLPGIPPVAVFAEDPLQTAVGAGIIVAAVAMVFSRRRFGSVLLLGSVGYGVAVLFILQGAPDLALTQFLIETLSVVVFVLVLRFLPPSFGRRPWRVANVVHAVTGVAVGVFVFVFALASGGFRPDSFVPVSHEFLARSAEQAGGHNVVNVVLVDFRGYDTLGEITVLAVAALGVAALVLASQRDQGIGDPSQFDERDVRRTTTRPQARGRRVEVER